MSPTINMSIFFVLPREIRDNIYERVLVCESRDIEIKLLRDELHVDPSILRTCKQIYQEASLILYTKNRFLICEPGLTLRWFNQIGLNNFRLLKRIRFDVSTIDDPRPDTTRVPFWSNLLNRLAEEATGLRHVEVFWDIDDKYGIFSPGKDLDFVRQLAKIGGLQSMIISGFYAKRWPQYLAEKMGIPVQELGMDNQQNVERLRGFQYWTGDVVP